MAIYWEMIAEVREIFNVFKKKANVIFLSHFSQKYKKEKVNELLGKNVSKGMTDFWGCKMLYDVAIVGAGLAGLVAACELVDAKKKKYYW